MWATTAVMTCGCCFAYQAGPVASLLSATAEYFGSMGNVLHVLAPTDGALLDSDMPDPGMGSNSPWYTTHVSPLTSKAVPRCSRCGNIPNFRFQALPCHEYGRWLLACGRRPSSGILPAVGPEPRRLPPGIPTLQHSPSGGPRSWLSLPPGPSQQILWEPPSPAASVECEAPPVIDVLADMAGSPPLATVSSEFQPCWLRPWTWTPASWA